MAEAIGGVRRPVGRSTDPSYRIHPRARVWPHDVTAFRLYAAGHPSPHAPREHRLRYGCSMLLIDLDELPDLGSPTALVFGNGLISSASTTPITATAAAAAEGLHVRRRSPKHGLDGGAHDPAAVHAPRPRLRVQSAHHLLLPRARTAHSTAMIYEVNNTFGERHSYLIPVDRERRRADPAGLRQGLPRLAVHGHGHELRLRPISAGETVVTTIDGLDGAAQAADPRQLHRRAPSPDRCGLAQAPGRSPLMT